MSVGRTAINFVFIKVSMAKPGISPYNGSTNRQYYAFDVRLLSGFAC
jgi:hypothetical protein